MSTTPKPRLTPLQRYQFIEIVMVDLDDEHTELASDRADRLRDELDWMWRELTDKDRALLNERGSLQSVADLIPFLPTFK